MIRLTKINEVFMHIDSDRGTLREISDRFSFKVPGYQYMPKFRNGIWDGSLRIFNLKTQELHIGLLHDLKEFAQINDYELVVDPKLDIERKISNEDFALFIKSLKLPENLKPREYQLKAIKTALEERRAGFLSPTSSGKSLIIYAITQFMLKQGKEVLIIVPTVQLVKQMHSDFAEYNNGKELDTHQIMAGVDKTVEKSVTISTWQSLYKLDKSWFQRFDCVIGDEVHLFKAQSLVSILEKLTQTTDRFGFTGTLDGSLANKMQIEALFGRFHVVTTTEKLMKDGHVSTLKIKALVLKYPIEDCKAARKNRDYNNEVAFINSHVARNKFIMKLLNNLEGNTLVMFRRVDTHGELLYNMFKDQCDKDTDVFFVSGKVDADDRETIRKHVDTHKKKNCVIFGSAGTMSTGTNMKKINHMVFVYLSKSKIQVLQSIGRTLRLDGITNTATLWDIVDDLRIGQYNNFAIKHFGERIKYYDSEKFHYKIHSHKL